MTVCTGFRLRDGRRAWAWRRSGERPRPAHKNSLDGQELAETLHKLQPQTGDARGVSHTGYGLAEHVRGGMVPIVPYDGGQAPLLVVGDVRRTDAVAGCG